MASGFSNPFSGLLQKIQKVSVPEVSPIFQGLNSSTKPNIKCWIYTTGKTLNSHNDFIDRLKEQIPLQVVDTEDACDFILVFCPIVSRAGTEIEAAVKKLQNISETKPAVLVVLHHTFNPECVVPESWRIINRKNMIAVDCLFHEDQGLLQCWKNKESLSTTSKYIKSQVEELYKNVRKQGEGVKSDLEQRNLAKRNEVKDARLLEDTNTKPEKMTSEAQESKNVQHEGDQQLNQKYTQEAQTLVEIMQKRLEDRQNEIHKENKELNDFKNFLEITEKTLSKKDAELVKANEKLQNATEQIKEKNTRLANKNKLLSEKETQLKNTDKELETSKNKLEKLGQELQDKTRQLQKMMIVLEQQKTELAEKNKQLEEKESLLTERETQLMERDEQLQEKDRLLTENTQTLQMKDKTLEEKDAQLKEVKSELEEKSTNLKGNERQLKQKVRQLENVGKELETSKNKLETLGQELQDKKRQLQEIMILLEQEKTESAEKNKQLEERESLLTERETQLMERDKQLQEKDRLLTENTQTLQVKDKTLEEKDTLVREEKEHEEEVANTGIGELPGSKCDLELESNSQEDKDQPVEVIKRQIGNENTEQNNNENLTQEKSMSSKDTNTEIENMAKEHLVTNKQSLSEGDAVLMKTNETLKKLQVKNETGEELDKQLSGVKNELGKTAMEVQEIQMKEEESELGKEVNIPQQEQVQNEEEQEQIGDKLARGTDN